jgi:uncharacterized cysteine cluster protein YcgN (CxxCxxCC family)
LPDADPVLLDVDDLSLAPGAAADYVCRMADDAPFWTTKTLAEMNAKEWESLCDGCGRCCLVKLEDEDTAEIYFTDIGCRLLDGETCRCHDYANRSDRVTDCVRLTADNIGDLNWLPPTCAYRLVGEGKGLYWWHPLVSGDAETVHAAGISVRSRVFADEDAVPESALGEHIVAWPGKWPRGAKSPVRPAASAKRRTTP